MQDLALLHATCSRCQKAGAPSSRRGFAERHLCRKHCLLMSLDVGP